MCAHGTFGSDQAPTAYRPPLYPLLLAGCVALGDHSRVAIGLLHVLLGVATVGWCCWPTGPGLGGATAGVVQAVPASLRLAALLVALDPILLTQSALVMTETLAAFLTTAGLAALAWTTAPADGLSGDVGRGHAGPRRALPADAVAVDARCCGRAGLGRHCRLTQQCGEHRFDNQPWHRPR